MARAPRYVKYFDEPCSSDNRNNGTHQPLSCGRLALLIGEMFREVDPGWGNARGPVADESSDGSVDADGPEMSAHEATGYLDSQELWEAVAGLNWAGASERVISKEEALEVVIDLKAKGLYHRVRRALSLLTAALIVLHPAMAACARQDLAQIVAQGREIAVSACREPDVLAYAKNELQDLNLLALLR